ncbi:MAG: tetratricopeptide repeat protein [Chloroflexi bacterium]|nr:tetratricopeptide repeat protein [Chloroflexota bacterium]
MAQALRDQQMTPADELRELLADSEKRVSNLTHSGAGALTLLENMDRVAELWPQLEEAGMDLRPEAGRWETLQAALRRKAGQLVGEMRARGGLQGARAARYGDRMAPAWWNLAEELRAARLRWLRNAAVITLGLVVGVATVIFILNRLFPVDPRLQAALAKQAAGQQKIERQGDFQAALADFQDAVAAKPDDADSWLWLGVVQQKLGDQAAGRASFDKAQALLGSELSLRLARAPYYLLVGQFDSAEADLQAALQQDPENPQAYYLLANVYESQGRYEDALTALQRAGELAEARKQAELTAMSRYRQGMLIQQMQARSLNPPTPTP